MMSKNQWADLAPFKPAEVPFKNLPGSPLGISIPPSLLVRPVFPKGENKDSLPEIHCFEIARRRLFDHDGAIHHQHAQEAQDASPPPD
jgi:hypothetical protein